MAKVVLGLREVYEGALPAICVRCGAPATVFKNWTFSTGLGGLPLIVLPNVAIVAGKLRVRLPFCEAHKHHWLRRVVGILGGSLLVGLFVLVSAAAFLENAQPGDPTPKKVLLALLCLAAFIAPVVWVGVCLALHLTSIRLVRYDRQTITLSGVAPHFVEVAGDVPLDRRAAGG